MTDRLIIFDCDGVLVDSEVLSYEGYRRVFARHGMVLDFDAFRAGMGRSQSELLAVIAERTGYSLPDGAAGELWPEIEALFDSSLRPTLGLVGFLERLEQRRCVASSSSPARIARSLAITGLTRFFADAVFSTSMVPRGKPAPDIFLHAAAWHHVPAENCCVIEDSPAGIRGAVAAGAMAIGYVGGAHSDPGHADRLLAAGATAVAATWPEVADILAADGTPAFAVAAQPA